MKKVAKADKNPRYRQTLAWRANDSFRSFIHNADRMAGALAHHTNDEIKARLVTLALNGSDLEKDVARLRLKYFES